MTPADTDSRKSPLPGELRLPVHSLETLGTQDGPGIRLVVFTQGCHMRCLYCHNPDTLELQGGNDTPVFEILERALRQRRYFGKTGGVTISGGEPTLHRRVLLPLFRALRAEGIHTCLDTNGLILDDETKALHAETDLLLLDIKHSDDAWHRRLTGVPNQTPLATAAHRQETGLPLWLRLVLVPGWTDQPEHLHAWGARFKDYSCIQRVEILPYHALGVHKWQKLGLPYQLGDTQPPSQASREQARDILSNYFSNVVLK